MLDKMLKRKEWIQAKRKKKIKLLKTIVNSKLSEYEKLWGDSQKTRGEGDFQRSALLKAAFCLHTDVPSFLSSCRLSAFAKILLMFYFIIIFI